MRGLNYREGRGVEGLTPRGVSGRGGGRMPVGRLPPALGSFFVPMAGDRPDSFLSPRTGRAFGILELGVVLFPSPLALPRPLLVLLVSFSFFRQTSGTVDFSTPFLHAIRGPDLG